MKCLYCGIEFKEEESDAVNTNPESAEASGDEICCNCLIETENDAHGSPEFDLSGEI